MRKHPLSLIRETPGKEREIEEKYRCDSYIFGIIVRAGE